MEPQLVVYCTQNQSGAEELFASLRSRLPGVEFQQVLTGTALLESLGKRTINPVVILMDFVFKGGTWAESLPGDLLTKKVLNLRPEMVVIGYAPGMKETPPDLGVTVETAFVNMGTAACFDTTQRIEDLVEELTGWLEDDKAKAFGRKIAPFTYGVTVLYYLGLGWLLFNRLDLVLPVVFNYFPIWLILCGLGMLIYIKCDLPEEISNPLLFIALPPLALAGVCLLLLLAITTGPSFGIAILVGIVIAALLSK